MQTKQNKKTFGLTPTQVAVLTAIGVVWLGLMLAFGGYLAYTLLIPTATAVTPLAQAPGAVTPRVIGTRAPSSAATSTPLPRATRRATLTPQPTGSPYPTVPPLVRPTSTPGAAPAAPQSPPQVAQSNVCASANVAYQREVHRINLDYLDRSYGIWISYYQDLINRATNDRDALTLTQAQQALAETQNQYAADVRAENANYKAAVPAACR